MYECKFELIHNLLNDDAQRHRPFYQIIWVCLLYERWEHQHVSFTSKWDCTTISQNYRVMQCKTNFNLKISTTKVLKTPIFKSSGWIEKCKAHKIINCEYGHCETNVAAGRVLFCVYIFNYVDLTSSVVLSFLCLPNATLFENGDVVENGR